MVILGWTELKVDRESHHVLPGLDIHVAHVNVVCRVHVLKRIGSFAACVATDRTVRAAIARCIVEIEGQPWLPDRLVMRVADPVPGRPGTDVEIFLVSIACAIWPTSVAHLAELVDRFIARIEIALAHLDPVSDVMTGLVRVLRRAETLAPVVRRVVPVGVEEVVGFDDESGDRLDLVVKNQHVGVLVRAAVIDGCRANVWGEAADRHCLPEIGFRGAEPTRVAIPGLGAVLQHDAVMGKSCVGPVEGAKEGLVTEHYILPAGLHAQALEPGEIPDQHVGSSHPQCAAVAPAICCRTPVMVPRIVLETSSTIGTVSAPGPRVDQFHIEIQVRREVVADTQPRQLLDVEFVCLTRSAVRRSLAGERVTVPSGTIHGATETRLVPHDRSHAEIGAHPEILEIKILSYLRIVEFVLFLLRNRARNDPDVGNSFPLRQFKRSLRGGRHE